MSHLDIVPELSVLAACLERAILDAAGNTCGPDEGGGLKDDAMRWIFCWCNAERQPEWSFAWVCESLNLCPYRVRRAIKRVLKSKRRYARSQLNFVNFLSKMHRTTATGAEVYFR